MTTKLTTTALAGLLGFAGGAMAEATADPYALEPCINGAVSASGGYATQTEEDMAVAEAERIRQHMNARVSAADR